MLKLFIIAFVGYLFFAMACSQSNENKVTYTEDGLLIKKSFYPETKTVHVEETYLNDTLPHGYWKEYFPDGQLKTFIEVSNGSDNGKGEYFYEDGSVRCKGRFKDGKRDSTWIWYDSIKNIKETRYYYEGLSRGQGLTYGYFRNKHYLSQCTFFQPDYLMIDGSYSFSVSFDSSGNRKWNGVAYLPEVVVNKDKLEVNELLIARFYQCTCYVLKLKLDIKIISERNGNILESFTIPSDKEFFYYSYRFPEKGNFIIRITTEENEMDTSITIE